MDSWYGIIDEKQHEKMRSNAKSFSITYIYWKIKF